MLQLFLLFVLGVLFLLWLFSEKFLLVVCTGEVVLIERLGRFFTQLKPGLHFLIPGVDSPKTVYWTRTKESNGKATTETFQSFRIPTNEITFDFPSVEILTSDRLSVSVNGIMFIRIFCVKKAVYEIDNLYTALEELVATNLRHSLIQLSLDQAIEGKQQIRKAVLAEFEDVEERWGIKVTRFEIQQIYPSPAIVSSIEQLVKARREAEAQLAHAEVEKRVDLLKTQTTQEIQMIQAQIQAKQKETKAEADALKRQQQAEMNAYLIQKESEAIFRKEQLEKDAQVYGETKRAEAMAQRRAMEAVAEHQYLQTILSVEALPKDYLHHKILSAAWEDLARSKQKILIVPEESTKLAGNINILHHLTPARP